MNGKNRWHEPGFRFGAAYFLLFTIYAISSPYLQIMLKRLGYSASAVGVFLGLFELAGILGPLVLAQIADRRGRYLPLLRVSGFLALAGLALLVFLHIPLFTFAGIAILSLGLKTPVPVLDSSLFKTIERGAAGQSSKVHYGFLRGLGSIGFVLVTLSVQLIPGFDRSTPTTMALLMGGFIVLYIAGLTDFPEVVESRKAPGHRFSLSWVDSEFLVGLAVIALGRLAMSAVGSFLSLYITEDLQWNAVGGMWALSATVEVPVMMSYKRLMKGRGPMMAVAISSVAVIARLLIYAVFPTKGGIVAGQLLHSLAYGLFQPAAVTFISLKTPPSERTTGMALLLGFGMGLPAFVGSAIGGMVVDAFGYRWMFASFAVFAVASVALYLYRRISLDEVR